MSRKRQKSDGAGSWVKNGISGRKMGQEDVYGQVMTCRSLARHDHTQSVLTSQVESKVRRSDPRVLL
jgi:hypothetical protein